MAAVQFNGIVRTQAKHPGNSPLSENRCIRIWSNFTATSFGSWSWCTRSVARPIRLLVIVELAKAKRINESYVTRLIRLNLLAPDIVEAALELSAPVF
jgi:hypothetical protein